MPPEDPYLDHYRREPGYMRTEAAHFAARHPKVARHLALSDGVSADAHIAHLIEAVAFLTAGERGHGRTGAGPPTRQF